MAVDPFDFQLNYSEPTTQATPTDQWELVDSPSSDWEWGWAKYRDGETGIEVHVFAPDEFRIVSDDMYLPASLIDRLQSLKALARKHFGEDWGKEL